MNYFLCVLSSLLVLKSNASDPLVGLLAQGEQPCFETVESENCDTPIHEVFTPKYKGTDTTTPNTKFYLFTSKSKERAELLHNCGGKLPKNSSFNSTEKTVFVVHGVYEGVCRSAFQREYKEQLFIRGGYNVILVDWTWGNFPDPNGAIINSFVAGEETGFVIKNIMMQNNYADGSKFHIIGHSAGAYISITAGKFIREWSSAHKLRRITLLDTGVLVYRNDDFAHNTTYKDAHFVDVIHADAGTCFGSVVGALTPLGHADFFPNGGTLQLSCYFHAIEAILRGDILVGAFSFLPQLCFHLQAIEYFKVSINHPGGLQIGVECDSYEDFLSGKCTRCCKENRMNCAVAGMDAERYFPYLGEPRKVRKYYYNLGLVCPYNEDYEIINKDC